ncbi:MAG: transcriptional regulator, GntR family [Phenylobacterium sp.]|nr:transcriptional regulator, GntR family [Phenylobacterium sp.]
METGKERRAAERVADEIRNAIVRGELTNNDSLPPEARLTEIFRVSRPTLREAIRILEGENLIEVSRGPRGGARVKDFTPELAARAIGQTLQASHTPLKDVFIARATIEPPAARMAALTNPKAAALALRKQIIAEYETLGGAVPAMARNMSEFHIRLVEVSGNHALALLGRALQQIVLTHFALLEFKAERAAPRDNRIAQQREALQSHERLAELIERGDGDAADAHWRRHMETWVPYWLSPPRDTDRLDVLERRQIDVPWRLD